MSSPTACPDGTACLAWLEDPDGAHCKEATHPFKKPCPAWADCWLMDEEHRREYTHLCRYPLHVCCYRETSCAHNFHYDVPTPCPDGESCINFTGPHRMGFFHTHKGLPRPCVLPMCRHGSTCRAWRRFLKARRDVSEEDYIHLSAMRHVGI